MVVSQTYFSIHIYFVFVSVILIKASFYSISFFQSSFRNVHSLYLSLYLSLSLSVSLSLSLSLSLSPSLSLSLSLSLSRSVSICQFFTILKLCCYINVTSFEIEYLWCVHKMEATRRILTTLKILP